MDEANEARRRTVLRTIGAGIVGTAALSGSASARGNYGNGNGIGAFLNEEAVLKDRPIWDSGVADLTGQSSVEVLVGTLTSVDIPEGLLPPGADVPEELPMAFEPQAVTVSPGTEVRWTWPIPVHHSVTSFNASADAPEDHGQAFDDEYHPPDGAAEAGGPPYHTFRHTFDEPGTHLYFCHPHGTPYPAPFGPLGAVPNHVGMRGAVIVRGR